MGLNGGVPAADESTAYPANIVYQHAAILNGLQPKADAVGAVGGGVWANIDLSMNVHQSMVDASRNVGGSPYELVEAYDPTDDLDAVQTRWDTFDTAVTALDPSTDLTAALALAIAQYDASVTPSSQIDAVVDAAEERDRADHLRAISRAYVGAFDARAVMNTQLDMSLAILEHQRAGRILDIDARLRLQNQQVRSEAILRLADGYLAQTRQKLEAERLATALLSDIRANRITSQQNAVAYNTNMEVNDSLWDLESFAYEANLIASNYGATALPRAITGREQVMAALMNSLSGGLQIGMATGMPGLGIATSLGMFAANMWGLGGRN